MFDDVIGLDENTLPMVPPEIETGLPRDDYGRLLGERNEVR